MEIHPALVHYPIALLVVGAALEILGRLFKRSALSTSAHHVLIVGGVTALAAVVTGLIAATGESHEPDIAGVLARHRLLGLITLSLPS